MLSLSADISESSANLQMINGDESATEGDVEYARALMRFAEAVARRDEESLPGCREQLLREAGPEVLVDAAGVAANFQRMVRIADSTGIPIDVQAAALSTGVRKSLDLERFPSAENSPRDTLKTKLLSLIARPIARRLLGTKR